MLKNLAMQLHEDKGTWDAFPWGEGTATVPLECESERLQVNSGQRNWK